MDNILLNDQTALINLIVNNNWPEVAKRFRALSYSYIDTEDEVRAAISDMLSENDNDSLAYVLDVPLNTAALSEVDKANLAAANAELGKPVEKSFLGIVTGVTGLISTVFGGKERREVAAAESAAIQAQAAAEAARAGQKAKMVKYLMWAAIGIATIVAAITVVKIVKK